MAYNLFISHSWTYEQHYNRLKEMLNTYPYFSHNDFSVPPSDPIHTNGTDAALRQAIQNKIQLCHVVIVMAGVYSTYSKWINKEIEIANVFGKPILAVRPWAQTNLSSVVQINAHKIVGWNSSSIVEGIRELAR